ncbi:MAG: hypothetical protein KGL39_22515, partial [Patescibacteria group bacterium]|nr:hypothetical protein [Patescibacteria group bacterium]
SRKVDYDGWSTKLVYTRFPATCADELGNRYKRIDFGFGVDVVFQKTRGESIYPQKNIGDLLVFEVPVKAAKELRFSLPGEAVDEKGAFRLKVPLSEPDGEGVIYAHPAAAKKKPPDRLRDEQEEAKRKADEEAKMSPEEKAARQKKLDEEKAARDDKAANSKLRAAESLRKAGKQDGYRRTLKELVDKYPETEAGKKAAGLLKK